MSYHKNCVKNTCKVKLSTANIQHLWCNVLILFIQAKKNQYSLNFQLFTLNTLIQHCLNGLNSLRMMMINLRIRFFTWILRFFDFTFIFYFFGLISNFKLYKTEPNKNWWQVPNAIKINMKLKNNARSQANVNRNGSATTKNKIKYKNRC